MTPFPVTEVQEALASQATEVVRRYSPTSAVRERRDRGLSHSTALWEECRRLGWPAVPFPEAVGGLGLGLVEMAVLLEPHGRCLATTPLFWSSLLGTRALALGGSHPMLASAIRGEATVALAIAVEGDLPAGPLSGEIAVIGAGSDADAFVVASGCELHFVPRTAPGLTIVRRHRIDGPGAASLQLRRVRSEPFARRDQLVPVLEEATIALSAEMLGGATECFERTIEWLKVRHQFGVPIGSFQALQHRAARLLVRLELARATVRSALQAPLHERPGMASICKALSNQAYSSVTAECVQMHGGIGVTDECDIGLFLKRARAASFDLGTEAWHRQRWATLHGY